MCSELTRPAALARVAPTWPVSVSDPADAILLAVFILATSIWIGGYVAIAVIARTAAATLDPLGRVQFFRSLGRSYLWLGLPALLIAVATGALMIRHRPWDALLISTTVVVAVLLASFAVAVFQAKRMTVLRSNLLGSAQDEQLSDQVRRGALVAAGLRAALGLLSLALVVLGSFLAT